MHRGDFMPEMKEDPYRLELESITVHLQFAQEGKTLSELLTAHLICQRGAAWPESEEARKTA